MRIAAACAVLAVAFVAALLVGRGGGSDPTSDAGVEVKPLSAPSGAVQAPQLADTGRVPDLKPAPQPASTPSTSSGGSTPTTSGSTGTVTPTVPSTGGGGGTSGGGGSTPQVRPPG
jgi:hypothetical protein